MVEFHWSDLAGGEPTESGVIGERAASGQGRARAQGTYQEEFFLPVLVTEQIEMNT